MLWSIQLICLCLQSSTSLSYCRAEHTNNGYQASIFGNTASCIALVEVAGKKDRMRHGIHVVPNHDAVVAQYLFVYSGSSQAPAMDTNTMKIPGWDAPCSWLNSMAVPVSCA